MRPLAWLGGLLSLYLIGPIVALAFRLGPSAWRGSNGGTAGLASAWRTSAITATFAALVVAVGGIPLGYLLATRHTRLWRTIGIVVVVPLALPPLTSGVLLLYLVGPYTWIGSHLGGRLTDSMAGIVLAQIFVSAPFLVVATRSAVSAIDPAFDDLAAALGHRPWSRLTKVTLPLAAGGIKAGLTLCWLRAFGEFGATVLLAYHPYSLPVFSFVQFSSTGLSATLAASAAAVATAVVVLCFGASAPLKALRRRRRAPTPWSVAGMHGESVLVPKPPATVAFQVKRELEEFCLDVGFVSRSSRVALLGASGAGKTMTLRGLAGLEDGASLRLVPASSSLSPSASLLSSSGQLGTCRVGWVPQGGTLLPHLDVWEQVTFAVGADVALASFWVERLGILDLVDRSPGTLSGGERQRVCLARALAGNPDVLLLDEPFSSLDLPVRHELQHLLRELQADTAIPCVLVTHDADEAALLADEVVVIDRGVVLQSGTLAETFRRPSSKQVARLAGFENVGHGFAVGSTIEFDGAELDFDGELAPASAAGWSVRAHHIHVRPALDAAASSGPVPNGYKATVVDYVELTSHAEVSVALDNGLKLRSRTHLGRDLTRGASCYVSIDPAEVVVWPLLAVRPASASPSPGSPLS